MDFLSTDEEKLLQECLDYSGDFPAVLARKFDGLSSKEDERLRGCIAALSEKGFFSGLCWADNLPYLGGIDQKGFDYFHNKEIFVRAKLRQDPYFNLLDEESEKTLLELSHVEEANFLVAGNADQGRVLENLNRYGYIKFGPKGLSYTFGGDYSGVATVTQKGKTYFRDKDQRIEEILLLGNEAFAVNINSQYNISGNTVSSSPIQIGSGTAVSMSFSDYERELAELKDEIVSLKLSSEQVKTIDAYITEASNGCKEKNGEKVKKALGELWDFAKQAGSNMLAAYLSYRFGFQ